MRRRGGTALLAVALFGCAAPAPPAAAPTPSATSAAPTTHPTPRRPPAVSRQAVGRAVTIVIGGDVDLDRTTRAAIARDGVDAPWVGIAPLLRSADIAVVNLECAVSRQGRPEPKSYTFRGDPAAVAGAKHAGVDVVSLANNHTLDFGRAALLDTIAAVRAQGIRPVGGGRNLAEAQEAAVLTVHGRRIAFVGMTGIVPAPHWRATATSPGLADDNSARITAQVRRAKSRADIVVAFFHWGVEYTYQASSRQRRAARAAISAGASIVVGAHPHVLQPVEEVDGALVAWSLGNLVFKSRLPSRRTAMLSVTIAPDGTVGWQLHPYVIGDDGIPRPDRSRAVRTGRVAA